MQPSSSPELAELLEDMHEDEPHIDERWLVSYADMMTLLFGAFVMLYAMVDKMDVVKASAAKKFGEPGAAEATVKEKTPAQEIYLLQKQNEELQNKLIRLETINYDLRSRAADVEKSVAEKDGSVTAKLLDVQRERDELRAEVAQLKLGAVPGAPVPVPMPVSAAASGQVASGDIGPGVDEEGEGEGGDGSADGGGKVYMSARARARLPAGALEAQTVMISPNMIMLDRVADLAPGQTASLTLEFNGRALDLTVAGVPRGNGKPSNKLRVVDTHGNLKTLKEMMKEGRPAR